MTTVNAATAIQANAPAVLDLLDMFEEFATDAALETNGAWVAYKGPTEYLIARSNNDEYTDGLNKSLEENREKLEKGDDAAKALSKNLYIDLMQRTLLKGWKNVKYKGKVLEYSPENARLILQHDDFRAWVKRQADNREYFKAKLVEEMSKN
jgi:hypothetical protein